jgi:hypothetical protein
MAPNPNPARITDASWWLMEQLLALENGSRNGGIYADKRGYHNTRAANQQRWPDNYSIRDAEDQGGPNDKAAAYDWTFPDAQAGSYGTIARYCQRLMSASRDSSDPRMKGWREWFGQADSDSAVEGWDCRYNRATTSDSSHLWHIHFSEDRDKVTDFDNKRALLSVLRGETVEQWRGRSSAPSPLELELGGPSGDFDGDGKAEIAVFYDYSGDNTGLFLFNSNGTSNSRVWLSGPGNWGANRTKFVTGDFDGDGKSEIAALYDYGDDTTGVFLFNPDGTPKPRAWISGAGHWAWNRSKLAVGDFDGDGKSELAVLYDYGNDTTGLFLFNPDGTPRPRVWLSGEGHWGWSRSKLAVGDFNGDGKSELAVLYDYGSDNAGLLLFNSDGTPNSRVWLSGAGNWAVSRSKLAAGDFDGDGKSELAVLYDYGNDTTGLFLFNPDGTPRPRVWLSGAGHWGWNRSKLAVGDFNGDGKSELAVLYDYGSDNTGLILFNSDGTPNSRVWLSGAGNWSWGRSILG